MKNISGIGENAGDQHFLLFPLFFLSNEEQNLDIELYLFYGLQMLSIKTNLTSSRLVKGLPFPTRQILDSSKLKELADENFKFDKKWR